MSTYPDCLFNDPCLSTARSTSPEKEKNSSVNCTVHLSKILHYLMTDVTPCPISLVERERERGSEREGEMEEESEGVTHEEKN